MRIDLMSRSSDLAKLFRSQIKWTSNFFQVRFYKPKEWRPEGKYAHGVWSVWVTVYKYDIDTSLCTYRALQEYLARTQGVGFIEDLIIEGVPERQRGLFCALHPANGVYHSLKSGTISNIAHRAMINAGISPSLEPSRLGGPPHHAHSTMGW